MSDDSKRVTTGAPPAVDESQVIAERRAKLAALRTQGNPFPNDFRRDALAGELHARYDAKTNEEL
jgi:lysyl-tRNA synthetase class 2